MLSIRFDYTIGERARGIHVLLAVPLPRRIASRPVAWMAETIELGGAVPSMKTSWSLRLASTLLMPTTVSRSESYIWTCDIPSNLRRELEISLTQPSQVMGTAKVVWWFPSVSSDSGGGVGDDIPGRVQSS